MDVEKLRMASFRLRFMAAILDFIIFVIALVIIFAPILVFFIDHSYQFFDENSSGANILIILYFLVFTLISLLYEGLFESSKYKGTPGKIIVKIKVVDYKGKRVSFSRSLGRNLAKLVSTFFLCLGYILIIFTKRKQSLHDILAKTYVVKENSDLSQEVGSKQIIKERPIGIPKDSKPAEEDYKRYMPK